MGLPLAERILSSRQAKGLSRQILAERVGLSRESIRRIEAGLQTPSLGSLQKIARVLGTPLADLFKDGKGAAA